MDASQYVWSKAYGKCGTGHFKRYFGENSTNRREKTRDFLVDWCKCYVYCFTNESTDKWKKKFMEDRLNRFLEDNKDMFETTTGIELNEKNLKDFKAIYREMFMAYVEEYLKELKKAKTDEAKEKILKDGVKKTTKKSKKK